MFASGLTDPSASADDLTLANVERSVDAILKSMHKKSWRERLDDRAVAGAGQLVRNVRQP
jgi:hypothetical protein